MGHGGQGQGRHHHPRRSPLHPDQRGRRPPRADPGRQRHRLPRRPRQLRPHQRAGLPGVRRQLHQRRRSILSEDFADTEDLDGLFSGYDPDKRTYDITSWQYDGLEVSAAAGQRRAGGGRAGTSTAATAPPSTGGLPPARRPDPPAPPLRVPGAQEALRPLHPRDGRAGVRHPPGRCSPRWPRRCAATRAGSGRRPSCYAVGWTQHTVGVQYIRTASILQLLLGNIGRPGGGILALRGHASIQGSTDIPTLYDLLPGYLPMPHAASELAPAGLHRAQRGQDRLLGPHGRLHRQPAQGVLGRRGHRRQRLLLRLPAPHHRRPLPLPERARA